jgi:hypothetical protein
MRAPWGAEREGWGMAAYAAEGVGKVGASLRERRGGRNVVPLFPGGFREG